MAENLSSESGSSLVRRLRELEAENRRLKKRVARLRRWYRRAGSSVGLILLGPSVVSSIRAFADSWSPTKPFPKEPAVQLVAALLRRWVFLGILGLVVGLLPIVLLWWQNLLIRAESLRQEEEARSARRATYVATIYNRVGCGASDPQDCPPEASTRSRQEAVLGLLTLPASGGGALNLRDSPLAYTDLSSQDLSGIDLSCSNLAGANLTFANLVGTILVNASLKGSTLFGVDLSAADLRGADLREADLELAKLTEHQLTFTLGDSQTVLPEQVKRPEHWAREMSYTQWRRQLHLPTKLLEKLGTCRSWEPGFQSQ